MSAHAAIDPTNMIALVADSVDVAKQGDFLKMEPDNKVYIIDLKARPPKLARTVTGGRQPSGLSFSPLGDLALVANSADKSISVLAVKGTDVKVVDTIEMGDIVSHVTFTPDGKRALAAKFDAHKIALLNVNGHEVNSPVS
jgi:DNA-binding beta-propeller fold protein YncE